MGEQRPLSLSLFWSCSAAQLAASVLNSVCERDIRMYVTHRLFKRPLFPDIWTASVQETDAEHRHSYMREANITFGNTEVTV